MPLRVVRTILLGRTRWRQCWKTTGLRKEFINKDIHKPQAVDAQDLAEWIKCVTKARRIILEGVWDHIFSNLHGKETPYAMWKALTNLFQNNIDHRKLALKEKLRKIKMEKGDTKPKYLTKFTQHRDELKCQCYSCWRRYGQPITSKPYQELAMLPRLSKWEGEATRVGAFVVRLGARRDSLEQERWILIQAWWWGELCLSWKDEEREREVIPFQIKF